MTLQQQKGKVHAHWCAFFSRVSLIFLNRNFQLDCVLNTFLAKCNTFVMYTLAIVLNNYLFFQSKMRKQKCKSQATVLCRFGSAVCLKCPSELGILSVVGYVVSHAVSVVCVVCWIRVHAVGAVWVGRVAVRVVGWRSSRVGWRRHGLLVFFSKGKKRHSTSIIECIKGRKLQLFFCCQKLNCYKEAVT